MEVSAFDDVIVSIVNRDSNEVIFPTLYGISRMFVDKSPNVIVELIGRERGKIASLVFPLNELASFISDLEIGMNGSNWNVATKDWFLIYIPPFEEDDDSVWMCKLSGIVREESKVLIIFNWIYYKEDDRDAIKRIKEFASSPEVQHMGEVFDQLRSNGMDELQGAVLDLAEKTGLHFLDLEKEFSPVDAAIQILQYKRYHNMYMKINPEAIPLDIIFDTGIGNVEKIVVGLKNMT